MGQVDWALLTNWIISGLIGLLFGLIGGWVTYRFDRNRDDIAWQREKQKIQDDWRHQKELLEVQFGQRLKELELQLKREENERLREALLKGVDNPIETIDTLTRAKVRFQMEHLVKRAEIFVPESRITDYLLSLRRMDIEGLENDQLRKITSEVTRADLALAVLQELQARLEQSKVEEDAELGTKLLEDAKTSRFIEDMRHHLVWHHHDANDAKGSTWSAIASEAGRFNYDYRFLVYFLKLKNKNSGWQIQGTPYTPVPIPSIHEFIEILEVRLMHLKKVIGTGDLTLKWDWPPAWGHVPWNGPIINTDTVRKLPDDYYLEIANREYAQTEIAIKQYRLLSG